ncbi:MAG: hypothetical protein QM537_05940 [Candidatus Symbiobacter sp.]|nr:hypothetical protein [Candidatus Symbiobacter sp.]
MTEQKERKPTEDTATQADRQWKPGEIAPQTGEYHCGGCGHEIHVGEHGRFPPENHHQHSPEHGAIRWQLIQGGKSDKPQAENCDANKNQAKSESDNDQAKSESNPDLQRKSA